ncbi:MAG TPA: hypothetical protein VK002_03635 [Rubricoccaceae bacterium]|nr:hypothetical protein [Rubricoccaceae bacterium]
MNRSDAVLGRAQCSPYIPHTLSQGCPIASRFARIVVLALPLPLLSGCDLIESSLEEIVIEATGTVVSAETGEPIVGLGVAIQRIPSSFGATVDVAMAETDAEGQFSIHYETSRPRRGHPNVHYAVVVNSPYDSRYTTFRQEAFPPPDVDLDLGVMELEEAKTP